MPETSSRFSGVWTVSPGIDGWRGAWRAGLTSLPLASGSVSRLDLRFVLESVPEPESLLAECARALREDGRMLVFGLNPWGLARLRWARRGVRALERGRVANLLKAEGLDLLAQRTLGPRWAPRGVDVSLGEQRLGLGRVAWAILATRRSAALTPLRRGAPAWRATPGVPAS